MSQSSLKHSKGSCGVDGQMTPKRDSALAKKIERYRRVMIREIAKMMKDRIVKKDRKIDVEEII